MFYEAVVVKLIYKENTYAFGNQRNRRAVGGAQSQ